MKPLCLLLHVRSPSASCVSPVWFDMIGDKQKKRMKDNIFKACKKENLLEWYEEQKNCPASWKKLKRWYNTRCPQKEVKDDSFLSKGFPVLQYKSSVRNEESLLRDGVYEMMHLVAFQQLRRRPRIFA